MDGWMVDGWVDGGWIDDGWVDGWVDGWMGIVSTGRGPADHVQALRDFISRLEVVAMSMILLTPGSSLCTHLLHKRELPKIQHP